MKRVDKKREEYKYIGKGALYLKKRKVIEPGETFLAFPEEIPLAFEDVIKPVAEIKAEVKDGASFKPEMVRLTGAMYNVLGWDGKPINPRPVKKPEAEEILSLLLSEKLIDNE